MSHVNFKSEDFDKMGREELVKLFNECKIGMFYHIQLIKEIPIPSFQPYLLSSYFRIVYHVKTMKPTRPSYPGDMYYYDYDNAVYLPNAEIHFTELIKDWWKDRYLSIKRDRIFDDLRDSTYFDRYDFKLDPKYIAVAIGMLVVEQINDNWTIKITNNSPEYFVINRIPVEYNPQVNCPKLINFLTTSLPDQPTEIIWIQQYTGYSLYRAWPFDYVMQWIGDGDNGKTTLMNLIEYFLGIKNITSASLQDLCHGRWYLAEMWGKLANLKDDLSDEDLKNTGKFKEMTGGRTQVQAERKFKDPFWFHPTTKHIFAGNQIPFSPDNTEGFHRRWLPIDWREQFKIGDPRRDPFLEEKLMVPEEMSGMLNWALEGLVTILNNKGFTNVPSWESRRARWEAKSNPVSAFIYDPDHVTWGHDVHYRIDLFNVALANYCKEKKLPHWNPIRVGRMIGKLFRYEITKKYVYIDEEKRQINCYSGICAKADAPPSLQERDNFADLQADKEREEEGI